jgi:hypothetical protein
VLTALSMALQAQNPLWFDGYLFDFIPGKIGKDLKIAPGSDVFCFHDCTLT